MCCQFPMDNRTECQANKLLKSCTQDWKDTFSSITAVNLHASLSFVENKIHGLGQTTGLGSPSCTAASLPLME